MAEIQIVYREGYCDMWYGAEYSGQCHTMCASDTGCEGFMQSGPTLTDGGHKIIPFGDCAHAKFEYKLKGCTAKRYDMEECRDPYNPHLDSMIVRIGKREYDCVKVTLDGKCIFNEYDE